MKNGKRILAVKLIREFDSDPDTSYLGEYSNRPDSEFSIDRAHSENCTSVDSKIQDAKKTLEHVQQTVGDLHNDVLAQYNGTLANEKLDAEKDALDTAYETVGELIDSIDECDCGFSGHWDNREYRYFNPSDNYKGEPAEDIRKYVRQDFERMESLNNGNRCYLGIRAEAAISLPVQCNRGCVHGHEAYYHITQTISSGGIWGIESDSEKSYLESEEKTQLAELKTQLTALGFSKRAISKAFQSVERKDN